MIEPLRLMKFCGKYHELLSCSMNEETHYQIHVTVEKLSSRISASGGAELSRDSVPILVSYWLLDLESMNYLSWSLFAALLFIYWFYLFEEFY